MTPGRRKAAVALGVTAVMAIMTKGVVWRIDTSATPSQLAPRMRAAASPKSSGEDLQARWEFDLLRLRDPVMGRIPPGIRSAEIGFARQLNLRQTLNKSTAAPFAAEGWVERGPNNIGGRTRALAVDVSNHNVLLAGGVSGGMWKSRDGGASWTKTTGASELHSVTALAQDTRADSTHIWYHGTGEFLGNSASAYGGAAFRGNGISKSIDGGESWSVLSSTANSAPETFTDVWQYVWSIATDPSNDTLNVVYAATYGAIWRSVNGGASWVATRDGSTPAFSLYTDVVVTTGGVVYAALSSGSDERGIWRSTDGVTWTSITPTTGWPITYGRIDIAIAPSAEAQVYFLIEGTGGAVGHDLWHYQHVSGDGSGSGGVWSNRTVNLPNEGGLTGDFDSQGGYDLVIAVKPDDAQTVIIGGTVLYRSTDGFTTTGATTRIGGYGKINDYSQYAGHHPDNHVVVFHPLQPDTVYSAHDGGISRTWDILANTVVWDDLNEGYNVTQFYSVAIDPLTATPYMLAGAQDNGNLFSLSGSLADWFEPCCGGDGTYGAIAPGFAPGNGTVLIATQLGWIIRIRGLTGENQFRDWTTVRPLGSTGQLFVNPFVLDPADADYLYYPAGSDLWVQSQLSTYPAFKDVELSTGWTKYTDLNMFGRTITALAISRQSPARRLYYGSNASGSTPRVHRLDDAHMSSSVSVNVSPTGIANWPTDGWINNIAINPADADEVIVVLSNYKVSSLWHSADAGQSWTEIEGNLAGDAGPSLRAATILPLSATNRVYMLATSTGVYSTTSLSAGATVWTQENMDGIGNVVVDWIESRPVDGLIAVATHGRGAFSINFAVEQPLAVADTVQMLEDAISTFDVLANDLPVADLPLSLYLVSKPDDGFAEIVTNGIKVTPDANFAGTLKFIYGARDELSRTVTAGVVVTVIEVNDAPVAVDDNFTAWEDSSMTFNPLINDTDVDSPLELIEILSSTTAQIVVGAILYTPPLNFAGVDSFMYVIRDQLSLKDTGRVIVTVLQVNDAPGAFEMLSIVGDSSITVPSGTTGETLEFIWTKPADVEGDSLSYVFEFTGDLTLISLSATSDTSSTLKLDSLAALMLSMEKQSISGTWNLFASDGTDSTAVEGGPFNLTIAIGTVGLIGPDQLPSTLALHQNYPNPFNPTSTIRYDLPEAGAVTLVIYDLRGREVIRLVDAQVAAGYHQALWDSRDKRGQPVPTGLYIARLTATPAGQARMVTPTSAKSIKMVLLK